MSAELGSILASHLPKDAVHVAIATGFAAERLNPGERITCFDGNIAKPRFGVKPVAIVDPFLDAPVTKGQYCRIVMLPGQAQGMRHEWSHPMVASNGETAEVKQLRARVSALEEALDTAESELESDECRHC